MVLAALESTLASQPSDGGAVQNQLDVLIPLIVVPDGAGVAIDETAIRLSARPGTSSSSTSSFVFMTPPWTLTR